MDKEERRKMKMRQYRKAWERRHWDNRLWNNAKRNARNKGRPFTIETFDIVIPAYCPILGVALIVGSNDNCWHPHTASLDCKDPTKGYVKDNIWVISSLANRMKQNASREELIAFAEGVLKVTKEGLL